jgi:hypothetical protein
MTVIEKLLRFFWPFGLNEGAVARLSRITSPYQRDALLQAMKEGGEEIPDYAWHPIPVELDSGGLYRNLQSHLTRIRLLALQEGTTLEAMIEADPKGAAATLYDEVKFAEVLKKVRKPADASTV